MAAWSNGNSFSDGRSMTVSACQPREPYYIRLLSLWQDRGSI